MINYCGCQRLSALRQSQARKKADVGKFVSNIVCISKDIYIFFPDLRLGSFKSLRTGVMSLSENSAARPILDFTKGQ